jgi:hypothetical protein
VVVIPHSVFLTDATVASKTCGRWWRLVSSGSCREACRLLGHVDFCQEVRAILGNATCHLTAQTLPWNALALEHFCFLNRQKPAADQAVEKALATE